MFKEILNKLHNNINLSKEDALFLLNVENNSSDYHTLLNTSNDLTRNEYNNKGYIFAQIGLNAEPCSKNCKFCSMASSHYAMDTTWKKSENTILEEAKSIIKSTVDDLFLMITADYNIDNFIYISSKVKKLMPST